MLGKQLMSLVVTYNNATHTDIEKISFKPASQDCLDDTEKEVVWRLEQSGLPLRNIVFTSVSKGESDFDLIMPPDEQIRWLNDHSFVDLEGERLVDPALRRKYKRHYEKFSQTPYANEVIDVLKTYIKVGIPVARRREVSLLVCVMQSKQQRSIFSHIYRKQCYFCWLAKRKSIFTRECQLARSLNRFQP